MCIRDRISLELAQLLLQARRQAACNRRKSAVEGVTLGCRSPYDILIAASSRSQCSRGVDQCVPFRFRPCACEGTFDLGKPCFYLNAAFIELGLGRIYLLDVYKRQVPERR